MESRFVDIKRSNTIMKKISAFSLMELSVVVLIIGLLIGGIVTGSEMVNKAKISSAKILTAKSGIDKIANIVAWYETTSQNSFDATEARKDYPISVWHDISSQNSVKLNGTQSTSANQPTYVIDSKSGLPMLLFDGVNDYFNLPNGTIPYGNNSYSVFIVAKATTLCNCGVLGAISGANTSNIFRYDTTGKFYNYWNGNDVYTQGVIANKLQGFSFIYNNFTKLTRVFTSATEYFAPGVSRTTPRNSTMSSNYIGRASSTEYMSGNIGEIIIFDRALTENEITAIHSYLRKKWNI